MCAGSSSRFDSLVPKFLVPLGLKINPELTLLDLVFIRLRNLFVSHQILLQIPIIITYNQKNFTQIRNFFRQRNYFGFQKMDFRFMQVEMLPVLDLYGKYCLNEKYKLIKRPFGTGRTVIEILKERNIKWLKDLKVKYLHFIGAENLVESPLDLRMLGLVKKWNKKIVTKCVESCTQWQKLPRYLTSNIDGKTYLKFWPQLQQTKTSSTFQQSIYKYPIATNSIIVQLSYLEFLYKDYHTDIFLSQNYHVLRRKQKVLNPTNNSLINLEILTFEGDIRDIITCCEDPLLYFVKREENYAPICSIKEEYPLEGTVEYYEKRLQAEYNKQKGVEQIFERMKLDRQRIKKQSQVSNNTKRSNLTNRSNQ